MASLFRSKKSNLVYLTTLAILYPSIRINSLSENVIAAGSSPIPGPAMKDSSGRTLANEGACTCPMGWAIG